MGTPNKLLTVKSDTVPIASVTFHDSENTYTIDDFTFTADRYVIVLDPGHGLLLDADGVTLHYQRPATPTFELREDNLTLSFPSLTQPKVSWKQTNIQFI